MAVGDDRNPRELRQPVRDAAHTPASGDIEGRLAPAAGAGAGAGAADSAGVVPDDAGIRAAGHAPCDSPFDQLAELPRGLWLPSLIASIGSPGERLADARRWLAALQRGELPGGDTLFGDPAAVAPLRQIVGDLGLPALCRTAPAIADQVLRTLLWHVDRIVDHQPALTRAAAIERITEEFRAQWTFESRGLEDQLNLLQGLGDLANLHWDSLRGQLNTRPWQEALRAQQWLQQLPALAALIRKIGRDQRSADADAQPATQPEPHAARAHGLRAVETRLPDAPGEITGLRLSGALERMVASEAAMLRHPVLRKLWRARHAEARLLSWQTEAVLVDWRADPDAPPRAAPDPAPPEARERGPILLCLDTSGSMRGAPENIAKAVALEALRTAQREGRACKLLAFGGPDELLERDLGGDARGIEALLALMGQSFDGGTDIQTPIERAIECVLHAGWHSADLLIVSDGEFGCVPQTLDRLDEARSRHGLRVQGVLVGDRETMGLMEVCDDIHWVRDWRRYAEPGRHEGHGDAKGHSPVHSMSLTALFFPNALSARAARRAPAPPQR